MPQMAPMMWDMLFLYTSVVLIIYMLTMIWGSWGVSESKSEILFSKNVIKSIFYFRS